MRVIVGCEFTQIVTAAFRAKGHEAYSCDILPTEGNPDWHFQDDIFKVLEKEKFDLGIFHPPCTYLCVAGLHYSKKNPDRMKKTFEAIDFFMKLYNCKIPKIAIENPVGIISTKFRKPDQIIDPCNFGVPERKKTCLWLKGLDKLKHTNNVEVKPYKTIIRKSGKKSGQKYNYYWRQGKSARDRSRTFKCIADQMAEQWG